MNIQDRVYGRVEISEPVLLDIIATPAIQRLKKVDQIGYPKPYYPGESHSRFEHSVGVCALLQRYGASVEEQIAGLIHDVSHSAFSHCMDYALDASTEKDQSHQDNVFHEFIRKTEIPEIIQTYGFDVDYVLDDSNFPLKEKNIPDLCADRIDYSFRDTYVFGETNNADYFLNHLTVQDATWVFDDLESAKKYAEFFHMLNRKYYSSQRAATMLKTTGDYLRHGLEKEYISEGELYTTDEEVLLRLKQYHEDDKELYVLFQRMNGARTVGRITAGSVEVFCKSRIVDPLCWYNEEIRRVSDIVTHWADVVKQESHPKCHVLTFK